VALLDCTSVDNDNNGVFRLMMTKSEKARREAVEKEGREKEEDDYDYSIVLVLVLLVMGGH
jgi:hypothetical protein